MTKQLTFKIGEENRIVQEAIDTQLLNDSIFSNQYKKALYTLDSYFSQVGSKRMNMDTTIEDASNLFAFIGERGSGKTSCMMSIASILEKTSSSSVFDKYLHLKGIRFKSLSLIEPSFFDDYHNIISLVVSQIYTLFKNKREQIANQNKDPLSYMNERGILQNFDRVQRSLFQLLDTENNKPKDIESLVDLAAAVNLREDIHDLVDTILDFLGYHGGVLLVPIDDIDLNSAQANNMMEQIRKYLISPNIVIVMALKLDQLSQLKKQQFFKDYGILVEKNEISKDTINEMTERYISKLIPNSQRIFLPEPEAFLTNPLKIVLEDGTVLSFPSVRQAVTELIFSKTRYLFYSTPGNTSHIVPRNLRELRQLTGMLAIMTDYKEEVMNGDSINLYNKMLFKRYFFGNWAMNNLTTADQKYISEIAGIGDALQINSFVLNILKKRFKLLEERTRVGSRSLVVMNLSEINYLLNENNKYYNISLGDILSILELLDKQYQDIEDRKFLFALRALYSIKLYEYYDERTEQINEIKRTESDMEEVILAKDIGKVSLSNIEKLMSGRIFNGRLENNLLPAANGRFSRCDRMIDVSMLNSWMDECCKDWNRHLDKARLAELYMLCISRIVITRHRGGEEDFYYPEYRVDRACNYLEPFNQRQYGLFDLGAFFFNIQNIGRCYKRFKYGEAFLEKVKNDPQSLLNHFKMETLKREGKSDLKDYNEGRWLSWCTIRNVEIYDSLMSDLRNFDYKDSGNDSVIIRNFFSVISLFSAKTYDRNYAKNNYREIDFSFVEHIVSLLEDKHMAEMFNELFVSASVESLNALSREKAGSMNAFVANLMKMQFPKPPYKPNAVYRRILSAKAKVNTEHKEVLWEMLKLYKKPMKADEILLVIQSYLHFIDSATAHGDS